MRTECACGDHAEPGLDEEGLLRGDMKSRYEAYGSGISAGWLLRNDARKREGEAPVDGLDEPLVPLNLSAADIADMHGRAAIAEAMVLAGWEPDETLAMVGLPKVQHLGIPPRTLQQAQLLDPKDPTSLYLASPGVPKPVGVSTNGATPNPGTPLPVPTGATTTPPTP